MTARPLRNRCAGIAGVLLLLPCTDLANTKAALSGETGQIAAVEARVGALSPRAGAAPDSLSRHEPDSLPPDEPDSLEVRPRDERRAGTSIRGISSIGLTVSIVPGPPPVYRFALERNAPNPFTRATSIGWSTAERGEVSLQVFNMKGQEVARLVEGAWGPGRYRAFWNGTDRSGRRLASGVYVYRLIAGSKREMRKLLILR